jgi:putative nucleotidyltransferase with HDIG domain
VDYDRAPVTTDDERLDALRAGVRASLPELARIRDQDLLAQVVEVHARALAETEFERIEDIGEPADATGAAAAQRGSEADHYRGTALMALAVTDALEELFGPLGVDRDILVAAALCHDVGKAYEYSPRNRSRWERERARSGFPPVRHPAYGVHLALTVGLPEEVVHAIAAHPLHGEGALVEASLVTTIVKYCDHAYWRILERAE